MYQALYRKWRPRLFDDVVGQSHITRILKRQVLSGHLSHAYLFTGTRGTGKTTCAKLLARAVNCLEPVEGNPCGHCAACRGIEDGSILDVVELDAASNNGVDQVRALRDEAVYAPAAVKRRVYIIDEVHMLSVGAFNALLKILEEPPEHVLFILATTELHKVPATILSRCQRFSFQRIPAADIRNRLLTIASAEHIDLQEDAAALLSRLADGALRDALSLLDQCAVGGGTVDRAAVLDALGLAGNTRTAHLMNHLRRGESAKALTEFSSLYAAGKDVSAILSELSALARDLLLRQTAGPEAQGLLAGGYDEETLAYLSRGFSPQRLLHLLNVLQETQSKLRSSTDRRTDAELCLLRLCDRRLDGSVLSLSQRLSRLEAMLASGQSPAPSARPFAQAPRTAGRETGEEECAEAWSSAAPAASTVPPIMDTPPAVTEQLPPPMEDPAPPMDTPPAVPEQLPPPMEDPAPPMDTPPAVPEQLPPPMEDPAPPMDTPPAVPEQLPPPMEDPAPPMDTPPAVPEQLPPPMEDPAPPVDIPSAVPPMDLPPVSEQLPPPMEDPAPPAPGRRGSRRTGRAGGRRRAAEGPGDARFWQVLRRTLEETMPPATKAMLDTGLVMGLYWPGLLRLYVPDAGTGGWLSAEAQRGQIERIASTQAGREVRLEVRLEPYPGLEQPRRETVRAQAEPLPSALADALPPEPAPTLTEGPPLTEAQREARYQELEAIGAKAGAELGEDFFVIVDE